jgi:hypothetical protein
MFYLALRTETQNGRIFMRLLSVNGCVYDVAKDVAAAEALGFKRLEVHKVPLLFPHHLEVEDA